MGLDPSHLQTGRQAWRSTDPWLTSTHISRQLASRAAGLNVNLREPFTTLAILLTEFGPLGLTAAILSRQEPDIGIGLSINNLADC